MQKKIDVIIVKRLTEDVLTCEIRSIEDKLDVFYEIIDCSSIDIVGRYFGNVHFDVIVDDIGLWKANETGVLPTSWWQNEGYTPNHEGLFGTLILAHSDPEGNLTSVDPLDLLAVQSCYQVLQNTRGEDIALLFHDVEER